MNPGPQGRSSRFELANPVKMVVWDLDETFWRGVLGEGEIEIVDAHVAILRELAGRGIVSSICSKNDFDAVKRVLEAHDLWRYFVFPTISFDAKGPAIASLLKRAGLRPDNVLFIDDNRLNLHEALHFAPGLMIAEPSDIPGDLLSRPQTQGKPDPDLAKLRHYRNLQAKREAEASAGLDPIEFLRQSDIRIEIDIDIRAQWTRVIELINKSNQLNFTKKRLNDAAAIADFERQLGNQGVHAALVRAKDRYGDYGVIGFFMVKRFADRYDLEHFVFSCRVMNMGIEQFVFDLLKRPACEILAPVAHGPRPFPIVDWVRLEASTRTSVPPAQDMKLLLLGGCDLLQVATYCSSRRVEYVNSRVGEAVVRFDDFGFLLSPRAAMGRSEAFREVCSWSRDQAERFDSDLADAEIVVLSLHLALAPAYFQMGDGILVRRANFDEARAQEIAARGNPPARRLMLGWPERTRLMRQALERVKRLSPKARSRILLGRIERDGGDGARAANDAMRSLCSPSSGFVYLDIESLVADEDLLPDQHFTRRAAFEIAKAIQAITKSGADGRSGQGAARTLAASRDRETQTRERWLARRSRRQSLGAETKTTTPGGRRSEFMVRSRGLEPPPRLKD